MHVIGIVSEFNPYTLGHEYLVKEARLRVNDSRAIVISIMSGSFTQRGLPAIMPKSERAKSSIVTSSQKKKNSFYGPDIVLELPFIYACAPASEFAYGAIKTLTATGVITDIACGIDIDDTSLIERVAKIDWESNDIYTNSLKSRLKEGGSFPSSSANAIIDAINNTEELKEEFSDIDINNLPEALRMPNSILALEYMKEINKYNKKHKAHPITLHLIKRINSNYSSLDVTSMPSASAIRNLIIEENTNSKAALAQKLFNLMPESSLANYLSDLSLNKYSVISYDSYIRDIVDRINSLSSEELEEYAYMGDGLSGYIKNIVDSKLKDEDIRYKTFEEKISTKHFTSGRIYRALSSVMVGRKVYSNIPSPKYIRVLGFNKDGRYCLKVMSKLSKLPLVHNLSDFKTLDKEAYEIAMLDIKANNLQGKYLGIKYNQEWSESPVIVK